ncbi:peptidase M23, partial [Bacillus thuringiensis]|nr:peptidase M23 [Bacillus thuringiensis]
YGTPGTAGKFPPHFHFDMKKDYGYTEWSFVPDMQLSLWESKGRAKTKR